MRKPLKYRSFKYFITLTWMSCHRKSSVKIVGGTYQGEMSKGLGEISQVLPLVSKFLAIEADVVGVAKHFLEEEASLLKIPQP